MTAERRVKVAVVVTQLAVGGAQLTALECCRADPARIEGILMAGAEDRGEGSIIGDARAGGIETELIPALQRDIAPHRDPTALIALRRAIRRAAPDVVHTHSSKAGILGRLAARLERVPTIVHTVHGWSFRPFQPAVIQRMYKTLERGAARWTDRLVVVSEHDIAQGLAEGIGTRDKYVLIPSAIDVDDYTGAAEKDVRGELGLGDETRLVVMVGRLSPPKDPETLVRAIARLAPRRNVHLALVGGGALGQKTLELAVRLGLRYQVTSLGVRRDVDEILRAADVAVVSSHSEGMPRVIPEAMAAGVPLVASNVGGVCEVVEHRVNGCVVAAGDDVALAAEIEYLLDGTETDRLVAAGRETAKSFDVGAMRSRLADLYVSLAGPGG